ncbi:putative Phospholipase A2 inhibitor [Hypsibius exemplaris]|uniref:Phospholipase A2 inhibitor n=1 Tax=Hypsibius exemplaris TaxID=2072580 RepID=A0A1W0WRQ0_HYPEX|nr:putative Phospholipase A2 inhibitor [Hypsibius exemplaris]
MAYPFLKGSVVISLFFTLAFCSENNNNSGTSHEPGFTTTTRMPAHPDDGPVCASEECNTHTNKTCQICTETVFSCTSKQLKMTCRNYLNNPATLDVINLQDNKLANFDSFRGTFPVVTVLKLSKNELKKVTKDDLAKFPKLRELDLSYNRLLELLEDVFQGTQDLEELILVSAELFILPDSIFNSTKKLQLLDLSGNRFTAFPRNIFQPIWQRMTSLVMSYNPIKAITADDFKYLTNLERLTLEGLNIVAINQHTFSAMSKLQTLDMEHNTNLIYVDGDAFGMFAQKAGAMASQLKTVSFRGCGLHRLDRHVFNWRAIKEVGLSANPWICDCDVKWMAEPATWENVPAREKIKTELDRSKCTDIRYNGVAIGALSPAKLECVDPRLRDNSRLAGGIGGATTVLVITFLLCIISVIFAVFMIQRRSRHNSTSKFYVYRPSPPRQKRSAVAQCTFMPVGGYFARPLAVKGLCDDDRRHCDVKTLHLLTRSHSSTASCVDQASGRCLGITVNG